MRCWGRPKSDIVTNLLRISHILKHNNYLWAPRKRLREKNNKNCATLFACRMPNNCRYSFHSFRWNWFNQNIDNNARRRRDDFFPFIESLLNGNRKFLEDVKKPAWMGKNNEESGRSDFRSLNVQSRIDWITIHKFNFYCRIMNAPESANWWKNPTKNV